MGIECELVAYRAAVVHLDGRDPVPQPHFRGYVPRPRPLAHRIARTADALQRDRLRHFRRDFRLVRRHRRHHRQDDRARAAQARLPRTHGHRLARRRRHAGAADPALDHHDRLRRRRRRLDRAAVHRRRAARHHAHEPVLRLHHSLGFAQPRQDPALGHTHELRREALRLAPAHSHGAADRRGDRLDLHRHRHAHRSGGAGRGRARSSCRWPRARSTGRRSTAASWERCAPPA